ncbi:MAG: hypothetical protein O7D94_09210 [Planctomycetota bacterium]|nr:hypothetical protein [Planctomycetota bacterium]
MFSYAPPPTRWEWYSYAMVGLVILFVLAIVGVVLASEPMACQ